MQAKTLLFDIGKTLIDSDRIVEQAMYAASRELCVHGWEIDPQVALDAFREASRSDDRAHTNRTYSDLQLARATWHRLGRSDDYAFLSCFLFAFRRAVRKRIRPRPSLVSLFASLRKNGARLGVVSDGTAAEQIETLSRLGLLDMLDKHLLFISESVGIEKESPQFFHAILPRVGDPSKCAVIGDRILADVVVPHSVGFKTVLFLGYSSPSLDEIERTAPDYVISRLGELMQIVRDNW